LPQIFRIDLPEDLIQAVEDVKQTLINGGYRMGYSTIIRAQSRVPVLHYYSMGKSENIKQIARMVF
jgi:methylenetetrahydrofolate reductase (NADPH)